ncbi:MAG: nucleotidyltransferase domain-containing protein [archaeon]|jgi:predicted nucleotidyltransferase|nr:nucleotidyltransferase domain-containing protein [archaeon]MCK9439468.1 nucleotidyltransferase domain-containing protein [Patescibacteria group bacterium]MDD2478098.1 nucleotidyltransferase domain-containing protein [Candidatus ainarchaeum sp.]MDD3085017.1 nucleotidyltransferase domain-containing protein [Candidatus ainarchaeum sp.]
MLEKLFTSKTRINILSLLMFNQDSSFHLREIAKLTKSYPSQTSKELLNLESLNLIIKIKKSNLSIYTINKNNIFLKDLKNIFLKTEFIGQEIKIKLKNKVDYCLIFGSFAKGVENSKSDIDLLVISDSLNQNELLKIISDLEDRLKRDINYILWNNKDFIKKSKNNNLLKTINKDKIIMLIGDEDNFRRKIN